MRLVTFDGGHARLLDRLEPPNQVHATDEQADCHFHSSRVGQVETTALHQDSDRRHSRLSGRSCGWSVAERLRTVSRPTHRPSESVLGWLWDVRIRARIPSTSRSDESGQLSGNAAYRIQQSLIPSRSPLEMIDAGSGQRVRRVRLEGRFSISDWGKETALSKVYPPQLTARSSIH